jgi:hypothetical protein
MRASILIFSLVLIASAIAVGAEPLTPEALLPQYEKTHAHEPAAAFGRDVFLVVWRAGMNEDADLVGVRLDKAGTPLDTGPFVVSAAKDCQERPRVASDGTNFLVVWHDLRNEKDWDVYAARIAPDGKVLDPDGILVAGGDDNQCEPAVCFDGTNFQLVWRQWNRKRGGYDIHGGRLGPEGKPLDGPAGIFQVNPRSTKTRLRRISMGTPGVGVRSDGTLVAGAQNRGCPWLWLVKEGKLSGPVANAGPHRSKFGGEPMFASGEKGVLAVWTTLMIGGGRSTGTPGSGMLFIPSGGELVAKTVKGAATTAPSVSLATSKVAGKNRQHVRHPRPAWDGTGFVVAWDLECSLGRNKPRFDAVYLRRIDAEGKGLDGDERIAGEAGSPAFRPTVASDGSGTTLVAYERHPRTADAPIRIAIRILKT